MKRQYVQPELLVTELEEISLICASLTRTAPIGDGETQEYLESWDDEGIGEGGDNNRPGPTIEDDDEWGFEGQAKSWENLWW